MATGLLTSERQSRKQMPPSAEGHLSHLDGIRGLAALAVVLCHSAGFATNYKWAQSDSRWFRIVSDKIIAEGHFAVAVFIVLSGFCLMLPLARRGESGMSPEQVARFFKRRALRILPAYLAWLLLFAALVPLVPALRDQARGQDSLYNAQDMTASLVAHLLMLHNLSDAWARRIDNPMWTVGTEWQIYYLFPLALLPVWRKGGPLVAIALGYALGFAPNSVFPHRSCPWFAALFAMGMTAASLTVGPAWQALRESPRSRWLAAAAMAAVAAGTAGRQWPERETDMALGVLVGLFLFYCGAFEDVASSRVRQLLSCAPLAWLGACSYSLYLVHYPILQMLHVWLTARAGLARAPETAALIALGLPICLILAHLSYRLIEKPFLEIRGRA